MPFIDLRRLGYGQDTRAAGGDRTSYPIPPSLEPQGCLAGVSRLPYVLVVTILSKSSDQTRKELPSERLLIGTHHGL
jgi:hypothetical protein